MLDPNLIRTVEKDDSIRIRPERVTNIFIDFDSPGRCDPAIQ